MPFSEQKMQPELTAIGERVSTLGNSGDGVERYKAMIEGMARMYLGALNEAVEVATILDVDLTAKLYEPGATVPVQIAPLYERDKPLEGRYAVQVQLLGPEEEEEPVYESDLLTLEGLTEVSTEVVIPPEAAPGRYLVEYSLWAEGASTPIVVTARSIGFGGAAYGDALRQSPSADTPPGGPKFIPGTRQHDSAMASGYVPARTTRMASWGLYGLSGHHESDL